ncbi:unnamed protein product [Sympodiomycopsis kandeliae]
MVAVAGLMLLEQWHMDWPQVALAGQADSQWHLPQEPQIIAFRPFVFGSKTAVWISGPSIHYKHYILKASWLLPSLASHEEDMLTALKSLDGVSDFVGRLLCTGYDSLASTSTIFRKGSPKGGPAEGIVKMFGQVFTLLVKMFKSMFTTVT